MCLRNVNMGRPVLDALAALVPGAPLTVLADTVRDGPGEVRPWRRRPFEIPRPGAGALD